MPKHPRAFMDIIDEDHGADWAAWCSHCAFDAPLGLTRAVAHRLDYHQECMSCLAEVVMYSAIIRGADVIIAERRTL